MSQEVISFFYLILGGYTISIGFGIIIARDRGFRWVNQQWREAITWIIRVPINLTADLLRAIARRIR
jgi:hypothetical protein